MLVFALDAGRSSGCSQATATSPWPVTTIAGLRSPVSVEAFRMWGALQVPLAARTLPLSWK